MYALFSYIVQQSTIFITFRRTPCDCLDILSNKLCSRFAITDIQSLNKRPSGVLRFPDLKFTEMQARHSADLEHLARCWFLWQFFFSFIIVH